MRALRALVVATAAVSVLFATPALACRDVVGRPRPPAVSLENQDAAAVADGAALALGSITKLDDKTIQVRIDRPLRGAFDDALALDIAILVGCRTERLPVLPTGAVPGDQVLVVRRPSGNFTYVVLLESERGRRLITLLAPDFAIQ